MTNDLRTRIGEIISHSLENALEGVTWEKSEDDDSEEIFELDCRVIADSLIKELALSEACASGCRVRWANPAWKLKNSPTYDDDDGDNDESE